MGRTNNGPMGSASGKVGPLVYYKWKGMDCVRSRPRVNKRRKLTDNEVKNRGKFAFAQKFLSSLTPFIRQGFHNYNENQTAFNAAMSYTLNNAVIDNQELEIDHSLLRISKGIISPLNSIILTHEEGILTCQWDYPADLIKDLNPGYFRTLLVAIPDDEKLQVTGDILNSSLSDKIERITIPSSLKGDNVYHIHIGFVATDHSNRKIDSSYIGRITV